jgi:hypothetical protein
LQNYRQLNKVSKSNQKDSLESKQTVKDIKVTEVNGNDIDTDALGKLKTEK